MLTVIRAMANSAAMHLRRLAESDVNLDAELTPEQQDQVLAAVLEVVTRAGEEAVQRTPDQLEVLRRGGGRGRRCPRARPDPRRHGRRPPRRGDAAGRDPPPGAGTALGPQHTDSRYRYCVNFIVSGETSDGAEFEPRLRELGDSVLVVGDQRTLRVHVHTDEPGSAP